MAGGEARHFGRRGEGRVGSLPLVLALSLLLRQPVLALLLLRPQERLVDDRRRELADLIRPRSNVVVGINPRRITKRKEREMKGKEPHTQPK
jgi:hypothetical protein